LFEVDGAPRAYALYRINKDFAGKTATSVKEAMGVSPGATRAIWSYLSKIDWCDAIEANFLPADHSALFTFAEPRRMNWRLRDALWLRLVDVEAALKARSYFPCPPSIIEVRDEFCPWNKGRWRIGADGVTRVDKAPDMVCDADALAGVYLGGFTWREMVAAGRAQARDAFAVRMADRVFERDGAPWAPEIF
jgi:predicted acetyltransferase